MPRDHRFIPPHPRSRADSHGAWRWNRRVRPGTGLLFLIVLPWMALTVAGCGFKLRGMAELPEEFQQTQLTGVDAFSDLGVALRDAFRINGATLGASGEGATAVLTINDTSRDREVLGVSGSGRAQSFQMTFRVRFSASTVDGQELLGLQTIELRQDYEYDPDQVLSRENAEETAALEMTRTAAWRIIERLSLATKST